MQPYPALSIIRRWIIFPIQASAVPLAKDLAEEINTLVIQVFACVQGDDLKEKSSAISLAKGRRESEPNKRKAWLIRSVEYIMEYNY